MVMVEKHVLIFAFVIHQTTLLARIYKYVVRSSVD